MASGSNNVHGQRSTSVHDLTEGLEKELRSRADVANFSAVSSSPSSPVQSLVHTLASCLSNLPKKTSPRSVRNGVRGNVQPGVLDTVSLGLSSPHSSDSSMSGGVSGHFPGREMERTTSLTSVAKAGSTRSAGNGTQTPTSDTPSRTSGQGAGVQRMNSQIPASMLASGRNVLSASLSVGGSTGKVTKKRFRASKKPPTKVIEAEPGDFRATVQQLTGCPSSTSHGLSESHLPSDKEFESSQPGGCVVRPQPSRPDNIDIDSQNQPLGLQTASVVSPVRSPSPVSQARDFSYRDTSSASCTRSGGLNYCMGYDQSSACFGDLRLTEDIVMTDCNSQSPSVYDFAPELLALYASQDSRPYGRSASPTGSSVSMSLFSETNRMDDIAKENMSFSRESRFKSSDKIPKSCMTDDLVPKRLQQSKVSRNEDVECTTKTDNMVDSWLSPSDLSSVRIM